MYPRFSIALAIEPVTPGELYQKLPLHVTVLPLYRLMEAFVPRMKNMVRQIAEETAHISLISEGPALFGVNHDVPVHLVRKTSALVELHSYLHRELRRFDIFFDYPEWVDEGFSPHVTTVDGRTFVTGARLIAEQLYLAQHVEVHGESGPIPTTLIADVHKLSHAY